VKSPSLFGFIRPRVLLPADLASHTSLEELRYIFLHELAHFRRGDIWIGWIVALFQSLHWFNPFVWWAFYRMRADREIACDALALSCIRHEETARYGGALINQLERFSHSQQLPVVAGILENKAQLKKRMTMITQFKRPRRREGLLAIALLAILSMALLTDAKENSYQTQWQSANSSSTIQPIRVGGGIQHSKLIYKADPIYPENAKAAGLFGTVVLTATTDEDGVVADVRVVEGHPVLGDAAATAVKSWRYSPTFLKGEPVPVTTKVTIAFSKDGTVDTDFREALSSIKGHEILPILIPMDLSDPRATPGLHLWAEPCIPFAGRQYYTVVPDISAPVITLNKQRLREMADASWPANDVQSSAPMFFYLFINEDGRISGIRQGQGPKIPEIDRELEKTQVTSPARFGAQAVPAWVPVEIDVPKPFIQVLSR
jgi:TonB family protein